MKHARKLASLLLALVMVFAMATTAFADGAIGSITVDNPVAGQTYTAYKIFDVVYEEPTTTNHYSYTIKDSSPWFSTVQTYANTTGSGLTLAKVGDTKTYVVTTTGDFSAPAFADALKAAVAGKTGKPLNKEGNNLTVAGLELGYYFVTSTSGALCNLTTTNPTVTIHDKNDMPFEKKADKNNVDVGQAVNYTVTGKVPDYTGFKTYIYEIADTMSEGLTFNQDSIKVMVGGVNKTTDCAIEKNVDGNANSFKVTIPVLGQKYTIGAAIKVTYSAVLNEKAIAKIETNKAKLTYSNNPTDSTKTTTTPTQEQKVYSSKIVIDKVQAGNESTKLAGANFVLYKKVTTEGATEATEMYYKWDETGKKVDWVKDETSATTVTTDKTGAATFGGLANGTYYLVETKAPAGYNQLTAPVVVKVEGGNTEDKLSVTAKVENSAGALLPSTGGMGTTIFYVLGSILVIGAVVLLVTKKRMGDAE